MGLTSAELVLKYSQFPANQFLPARARVHHTGFMTQIPPSQVPEKSNAMEPCKHPRVQIVAREDDAEFVECLECREIFESSEFKDMTIEDTKLPKES